MFKSKPVTINGLSFPSIQAASIHLDIPETTLSYRLARGLSIETAEPRRDLRKERLARCKRGHAFTPENTRTDKAGKRFCRTCTTVRQAVYNRSFKDTYADRTLRPAVRVKPKTRRYCEMCDRWFGKRGDCPECGYPLRTAA